jgi:hypothetical protein
LEAFLQRDAEWWHVLLRSLQSQTHA